MPSLGELVELVLGDMRKQPPPELTDEQIVTVQTLMIRPATRPLRRAA